MALARDVYHELEDILGPDNISEDTAVLDAYAYVGFGVGVGIGGWRAEDRYAVRPEAIVLPGSTEEVQAVIKLCNRRGLKSKASSTGYGTFNTLGGQGAIQLDMRRMNRILDIDEKNMFILVEPYVSFAQVQAAVHKMGLNCHVIGAGSNCSYLASHTSCGGTNTQAISHGWGGRNLLGAEWILPTGEIVRIGSPGSGVGWFSGDGPGPSLRGIMRGLAGAMGGLGVFTKCAGHLHPWPGPPQMNIKGTSPYYKTEIPSSFIYHMIEWPTWEKCADAQLKIGEAGIAFALHKTGGPGSDGATVTGSNNEYWEKRQSGELEALPWVSYIIVMASNSPGEQEYQVKVLDSILEDTGGKIVPLGEESFWKDCDFINMVKACFIPRTAFRCTGAFACPLNAADSVDHCAMGLSLDEDFKRKYVEQGALGDDGTNHMWGVPFDGSRWAIFECGHFYDPTDEASCRGVGQMLQEGGEVAFKTPFGLFLGAMGEQVLSVLGPHCGHFPDWLRKVKKTFDPNFVSDASWYVSPEEK